MSDDAEAAVGDALGTCDGEHGIAQQDFECWLEDII
jgi:hypothetical protein